MVKKLHEAQEAAKADPRYRFNVMVLEAAMPERFEGGEIRKLNNFTFGQTWIPTSIYLDFVAQVLGVHLDIRRSGRSGTWSVKKVRSTRAKKKERPLGKAQFEFDPPGSKADIVSLFKSLMEGKYLSVHVDGKRDPAAEAQAVAIKDAIRERFVQWMMSPEQKANRAKMTEAYNTVMNVTNLSDFKGKLFQNSFLPDINRSLAPLHPHQLRAIERIIMTGNTLLHHGTGAGKTRVMIAAAQELKRMGRIKKPLFIVPNAVFEQTIAEYQNMYPTAKLLIGYPEAVSKDNAQRFLHDIKTGDYDAVIIRESTFSYNPSKKGEVEKLPLSPGLLKDINEKMLTEYMGFQRDAGEEMDEWQQRALQGNIDDIRSDLKPPDDSKIKAFLDAAREFARLKGEAPDGQLYLDTVGIDMTFVDEAQMYKGLERTGVALSIGSQSKRAKKMYAFTRYLEMVNPGRGIVFATATPVVNRIQEMYYMLNYLREPWLVEHGIRTLEDFKLDFIDLFTDTELDHFGHPQERHRPRRYNNRYVLSQFYQTIADIVPAKVLGKVVPPLLNPDPDAPDGTPQVLLVDPDPDMLTYMEYLNARIVRLQQMKKKDRDTDGDGPLLLGTHARLASLDRRMIHRRFAPPDFSVTEPWKQTKIDVALAKMMEIYERTADLKGVQLVFVETVNNQSTGFSMMDELVKKLVDAGVPESQIGRMTGDTSLASRQAIIQKAKVGEIRFVLGNTKTLGTGVNIQNRAVAAFHLDADWTPASMEQRRGRIVRQGNELFNEGLIPGVEEFYVIMKGSADARMFEYIQMKQRFVDSVTRAGRDATPGDTLQDIDFETANIRSIQSTIPVSEIAKMYNELREKVEKLKHAKSIYEYEIEEARAASTRLNDELSRSEKTRKALGPCSRVLEGSRQPPDSRWRLGRRTRRADGSASRRSIGARPKDARGRAVCCHAAPRRVAGWNPIAGRLRTGHARSTPGHRGAVPVHQGRRRGCCDRPERRARVY